jgi:hypothetical protein
MPDDHHFYWIGGSPCSGKSSIADALCARHNLHYYKCDDHFDRHWQLAAPDEQPVLHALRGMNWEQIWMRPVADQITDEIAAYHEQFPLILADLRALPVDRPILVEGAALLPELVAPLLSAPERGIWIVPTPDFQLHHYRQRPWIHDILQHCSDPDQAFQNWMSRDVGFAEAVLAQAAERDLRSVVVDGAVSLAEHTTLVEKHFGLA